MISGSGRFPGEGNGNPLQHSHLGKSHGQRSLVAYSPRGRKGSDMTEQALMHRRGQMRKQKRKEDQRPNLGSVGCNQKHLGSEGSQLLLWAAGTPRTDVTTRERQGPQSYPNQGGGSWGIYPSAPTSQSSRSPIRILRGVFFQTHDPGIHSQRSWVHEPRH